MYYSWPREPDQGDRGSLGFVRALAYIRAPITSSATEYPIGLH